VEAEREAELERKEKASSQDTFTLARNDGGVVALRPSSSLKASKNIRLDHMLEWEEMPRCGGGSVKSVAQAPARR